MPLFYFLLTSRHSPCASFSHQPDPQILRHFVPQNDRGVEGLRMTEGVRNDGRGSQ